MDDRTKLQTEIDRLNREQDEVVTARAKLGTELRQLDADLTNASPSDEPALSKILERQRALADRDLLLQRRTDLTTAALQRVQAALTEQQERERKAKGAKLRGALANAEAEAKKATIAAAASVRACVERVQGIAAEITDLEKERPASAWIQILLDDPLTGAAAALAREEFDRSLRGR